MTLATAYTAVEHFETVVEPLRFETWVKQATAALTAPVTFAAIFGGPESEPHLTHILEVVRIFARVPVVIGASAMSQIVGSREFESNHDNALLHRYATSLGLFVEKNS